MLSSKHTTGTTKLEDVQNSVVAQLRRDYNGKSYEKIVGICMAGLPEEAGEVSGLYKRELRDLPKDRERCTREKYVEELGDVLWYLTAVASLYGISLEEIWFYNTHKLEERYEGIH